MKILGIVALIILIAVAGYFFLLNGKTEVNEGPYGQPVGSLEDDSVQLEVPAPGSVGVQETVVNDDLQNNGPVEDGSREETKPQKPVVEAQTQSPQIITISYSSGGFSPKNVTISKGDTVLFSNISTLPMWPASNFHPTHTVYPGSGISKCNSDATIFDSCTTLDQGESFEFTFNEVGTWGYHNHVSSSRGGTITVE